MAARSVKAVRTKELEIIPAEQEKKWYQWLENIQDWCISRQLWWGHRIPAYLPSVDGEELADESENWIVAKTEKEALELASKKFGAGGKKVTVRQDPDVLDTWFSSGLFPFSVMGWPRKTPDLEKFFPGHLLETVGRSYTIRFFVLFARGLRMLYIFLLNRVMIFCFSGSQEWL